MNALALIIRPTRHGWAVYLTDGRELARFNGPAANDAHCATSPAPQRLCGPRLSPGRGIHRRRGPRASRPTS
jgi:hypothetical protein